MWFLNSMYSFIPLLYRSIFENTSLYGGIMDIAFPTELDLKSSLEFCKLLDYYDISNPITIDFKDMNRIEPFGMLLIGSKIRNENSVFDVKNYEYKTYAMTMGLFQSMRMDIGKHPSALGGNRNYIPIRKIDIGKSYRDALDSSMDIYDYLEKYVADKIVDVLSRGLTSEFTKWLSYSIIEVLRNVYDHSKSKELWYAGQYWRQEDLVEIAILDEGIGISKSLKWNKRLLINDDSEALRLAVSPGISRKIASKSSDIYNNEGLGLYMLKSLCEKTGDFVICSGSKCLYATDNKVELFDTSFNGTIIRIRIKPSKFIGISNLIQKFSIEAEEKKKSYKGLKEISVDII